MRFPLWNTNMSGNVTDSSMGGAQGRWVWYNQMSKLQYSVNM